jgi:hypothetical protein
MKVYLMEIISVEDQTSTLHGHTPYSNLAHKWAKDFTRQGGVRVVGPTTVYMGASSTAIVTEIQEARGWESLNES